MEGKLVDVVGPEKKRRAQVAIEEADDLRPWDLRIVDS